MQILNIAGYKFISLESLASLRQYYLTLCQECALKGTILLSVEGINLNLSGNISDIERFKTKLPEDPRFADIQFHMTFSKSIPFRRLKVKLKKEIITSRKSTARPCQNKRAPSISPQLLKQWLDENRPITLLDTRNAFEIQFGTFKEATHLNLDNFSDFPDLVHSVPNNKPIVMFCTGGIRCEKAALCMLDKGFNEVYQLDGGILGYFATVGKKHYTGECFVFDERIALDAD